MMLRRAFLKLAATVASAAAIGFGKIYDEERLVDVEPGDPENFSERIASREESRTFSMWTSCGPIEAMPNENTRWVPED